MADLRSSFTGGPFAGTQRREIMHMHWANGKSHAICAAVNLALAGLWLLTCAAGCVSLPISQGTSSDLPAGPDSPRAAGPELPPTTSAKVSLTVAETMEKNGQFPAAVALYERARQSDPNVHVARRLAPLYDRLGDVAHATAEYQRAVKENPRDADILNSFGYFYYSRGKWSEAEEQ